MKKILKHILILLHAIDSFLYTTLHVTVCFYTMNFSCTESSALVQHLDVIIILGKENFYKNADFCGACINPISTM